MMSAIDSDFAAADFEDSAFEDATLEGTARGVTSTLRTRRPVLTSGLTTVVRTTVVTDAANRGVAIDTAIIKQKRTNMFSMGGLPGNTSVVIKRDDTILADLSKLHRAGWVLTGGRSSRMGEDKALLELDGRALALRAADEVAKVCGSVALVGDPSRYVPLGLPVVADHFPGQGPLAGIDAALSATEADWNLIVACDMPSLNSAWLDTLFSTAEAAEEVDAVVPEHADGKREPLCAVYHRRCGAAVRKALENGVRGVIEMHSGLDPSRVRYVRVHQPEQFANLNTPAELKRYRDG